MDDQRQFPIQQDYDWRTREREGRPFMRDYGQVPWSVAEEAYVVYSGRYGTSQSLERLAERGGFGRDEIEELLGRSVEPEFRERAR